MGIQALADSTEIGNYQLALEIEAFHELEGGDFFTKIQRRNQECYLTQAALGQSSQKKLGTHHRLRCSVELKENNDRSWERNHQYVECDAGTTVVQSGRMAALEWRNLKAAGSQFHEISSRYIWQRAKRLLPINGMALLRSLHE